MILGSDDFVDGVKTELIADGSLGDGVSHRGLTMDVLDPQILMSCLGEALGIDQRVFIIRGGTGLEHGVVSELLYRYGGLTQVEVGERLGAVTTLQ